MKQILLYNLRITEDIEIANEISIVKRKLETEEKIENLTIFELRELMGLDTEITFDNMDVIQTIIDNHEWTIATIHDNVEYLEAVITFLDRTYTKDEDIDIQDCLENALKIGDKKARLRYSGGLKRFIKGYVTSNFYDSILDLCASLEGVLQINDELRLRLALTAYYLTTDKTVMNRIYALYKFRNDYIHNDMKNELDETQYKSLRDACRIILLWPLMNGVFYNKPDIDKNILNF